MIKKVIIAFTFLLIGVFFSIYFSTLLRSTLFDIYRWVTNYRVQFVGKDFFLFHSYSYYLGFGCMFSVIALDVCFTKRIKKQLIRTCIPLLTFVIVLTIICTIDGNLRIIECTACENGILKLNHGKINPDFILAISAIIAVLPNLYNIILRKKTL